MSAIRLPEAVRLAAQRVAGRYVAKLPFHLRTDDILQAALIGAFEAVRDFGTDVPIAFVQRRARWAICDWLRMTDFRGQRGHRALPDVRVNYGVDLERPDGESWEARLADPSLPIDELVAEREALARALRGLTPLERFIVRGYFGRGHRLMHIARVLGYSEPYISKKCAAAVEKLRAALHPKEESEP